MSGGRDLGLGSWADYETVGPQAQTYKRPHHLSYRGARHTDLWVVLRLFMVVMHLFVGLCLFVAMLSLLLVGMY